MNRRAKPKMVEVKPTSKSAEPVSASSLEAKNRNVARAIVIGPRTQTVKKANGSEAASKEVSPDDFLDNIISQEKVVEPPFDLLVLAMLIEHSTELQPAVEAMEINIEGFGYRLDPRVKLDVPEETLDPESKKNLKSLQKEVKAEHIKLTNFFNNCSIEDSFTAMRRQTRRDLELTGNAFWEVIRNPVTGDIEQLNHIPSHTMRLGALDKDMVDFERKEPHLLEDGSVELKTRKLQKRFRRYVQAKLGSLSRSFGPGRGHKVRWFKEFQDPRVLDNETGDFVPESKLASVPEEKRANEIIHWRLYTARSPYGLPRFIGNLITIFGDRAAEEINFITLKNNNIPSMAVLVSNGQLTEGSIARIQEFVESQVQGSENYSRFLLVEAEGQYEGQEGGIKVDIKPLTDQQMRDQMFQEYGKNNASKIRRAFRLPPIFIGSADDYSKATAEESRRLADEQVFKPERDEFDSKMNKLLLPEMGIRYHRFVSNGPNVTDDQDLIQILVAAERTGGLTPRIARNIISDILGRDLPEIDPAKLDPDIPFSLQVAEKVKNQAAMETGTPEIGSQATALKSLTLRGLVSSLLAGRDDLEEEMTALLQKRGNTEE